MARPRPGQQFKQDGAQRVNIARGRDRLVPQLFGTGVGRGGHDGCGQQTVRLDQLRCSKVQQLHCAVTGDEDIRRFQIKMHNQVAVRIGNRVAHAKK